MIISLAKYLPPDAATLAPWEREARTLLARAIAHRSPDVALVMLAEAWAILVGVQCRPPPGGPVPQAALDAVADAIVVARTRRMAQLRVARAPLFSK